MTSENNNQDSKHPTFAKKPTWCKVCNENTFKTVEDKYSICQGCMTKYDRPEIRVRQNAATENPDLLSTENQMFNMPADEGTQNKFDEVVGRMHKLSNIESQVLELLWEGNTQAEVSRILEISQQRVSKCLKIIQNKLR